ncbi:unnamed protein product [Ectocarpus sp. 12 AP-2014]
MLASLQGGSNSLRGGKKKYGAKTKCGNWVELNKEPGQMLPSGFPHAMYRTDAHQQMLEGVLQKPTRFGAGLPPPEDPNIDYTRVINYDKRQGYSQWAGITTTEFVAPNKCGEKSREFASSFKLTGGMTDPDKVREYRRNWTVEDDCVRPVRFKTDAVTSANTGVPARFRMSEMRKLPGTPKAVERLRAKALEGGQMGIVRLHQALQRRFRANHIESRTSDVTQHRLLQPNDLMEGLGGAGLTPLTAFDAKKVIDFCTKAGDDGASITDVLEELRFGGPVDDDYRVQAVKGAFRELDEGGSGRISARGLKRRYDAAAASTSSGTAVKCPKQEIRRALLDNFSLYQASTSFRDEMTSAGFDGFVVDASCGMESVGEFDAMLKALVCNN